MSEHNQKIIFFFCLFFGGLLMLWSALSVVLPSDEPIDQEYGQKCLNYYQTFGKDKSFADLEVMGKSFPNQKYYGAGFEAPAAFFSNLFFPGNPFKGRHLLVALTGILIVFFSGLISKGLGGWPGAILTVILLFTSPTFFGHSLYNSKDIPFAFGFVLGFYFFFKMLRAFPDFSSRDALGCVLAIAITVSVRIGGVILIPFLFLVISIAFFTTRKKKKKEVPYYKNRSLILKWTLRLSGMSLAGVLFGLLWYPNFWEGPVQHVTEALQVATKFPARIKMQFEGRELLSTNLPWYFLLKSIWLSFPVLILAGVMAFLALFIPMSKKFGNGVVIALSLIVVLPLIGFVVGKPNIYNGWRHFLFIYPFCIIMTVLVFEWLFTFKNYIILSFIGALFVVPTLAQAWWIFTNSPYQYTYYNPIAGSMENMFGNYDIDYQQLATGSALKWLLSSDEFKNDPRTKLTILSNNGLSLKNLPIDSDKEIKVVHTPAYHAYSEMYWDYAIFSPHFLNKKLSNAIYPPSNVIHEEKVGKVPIAVVVKRPNVHDYEAIQLIKKRRVKEAVPIIRQAYKNDSKNVRLIYWMGVCEYHLKNYDKSFNYLDEYQQLFPNSYAGFIMLGLTLTELGDFRQAEIMLKKATKVRPGELVAYTSLKGLYQRTGNASAVQKMDKQIKQLQAK